MKRECIGGTFHGQVFDVRDGITEVRIPLPKKPGKAERYTPGHDDAGRALLVYEEEVDHPLA